MRGLGRGLTDEVQQRAAEKSLLACQVAFQFAHHAAKLACVEPKRSQSVGKSCRLCCLRLACSHSRSVPRRSCKQVHLTGRFGGLAGRGPSDAAAVYELSPSMDDRSDWR